MPSVAGGAPVALAATTPVPYYSLAAYPDNPTSVWKPAGVAIAPDGDVIIADTGNNRIRVLSSTGTVEASFGMLGSSPGKLRNPGAVALGSDNRIYVADTGNDRVQVFERNGTFVRGWGTSGTANGQMSAPEGIAVGSDGRVYVSDSGNARIQVFSKLVGETGGVFAEKWGSYGDTQAGQFYLPTGIAVDSTGYVYVVDTNKHLVRRYNPTLRTSYTEWGWTVGTPSTSRYANPRGISIAPDGNSLLIADWANCRIERCGLTGALIESTGTLPASNLVGRFNKPTSAALAADGTWVVADTLAHRVQRRSPAGVWREPWSTPSTQTPYLSAPEAIASDPLTAVTYIADSGNSRILKYSPVGEFMGSVAETGSGPGQVSSPKGLLTLEDGTLLVSDTGNNRIQVYDSAGEYQGSFGGGTLSGPRGLAVNSLGTLFVADTGNNRVAKFAPSGSSWNYQSMIGTLVPSAADGEFNAPRGVCVNGAYLYVADTGNNRIQKFNANTSAFLAKAGTLGQGATQLNQPASVMAEGTGVVVADALNHRLRLYDGVLTPVLDYDGAETPVGSMREPAALAPAPNGRTLVLERGGCRAQVLVRDGEAPVTTVSGVPPTPSREATLTFAATDAGTGVAATYVRTGGVTQTVSGPIGITTEGTHTYSYWSMDILGNTESEQTTQVVIDRTAPNGTLTIGGNAVTATITVEAISAVEGASEMRFAVDASPTAEWAPYNSIRTPTLPDGDGTHTVFGEYRDEAGNVLRLSASVVLDRTGPAVAALSSPTHPAGVPTWGPVELAWDPASDPQGVDGYAVSIDSDPVGEPAGSITTTATTHVLPAQPTGTWYVHVRASDSLGNWGPVATLALQGQSDFDPPSTVTTGVPLSPSPTAVTIALDATDTVSGAAAILVRRDGGAESTYTAPMLFSADGIHTLAFRAVDRAGNSEVERTVTFTIDYSAPVGVFALDVGSLSATATVEALSAVEGASEMRFAVDASPTAVWAPYSSTRTIALPDADGTHTVFGEYRDEAGNVLRLSASVVLDRTGPAVTSLSSPTHPAGVPTWGPVEIAWDAASDPSGVAGYAVSIDSDPAGEPPASITTTATTHVLPVQPTGTWYVHVRARDSLGNWGPTEDHLISALSDSVDPVTTASSLTSQFTSQTVTFSMVATDALSGVDGTFFRRDREVQQPYTEPVVFSEEGTHTLGYWSVDRAGNLEDAHIAEFTIDRTAPAVASLRYAPHQSGTHLLVQWPAPADLAGVVGYSVLVSQNASAVPAAVITTTTPACRLERQANGPQFVLVRAVDAAGNWGETKSFAVNPRPVAMSRPTLTRIGPNPRGTCFKVSGSVASTAAIGTVRIVLEKRVGASGPWTYVRTISGVALTRDNVHGRATYATAIQSFTKSPLLSRRLSWRVRTYWAGNAVLQPAVSASSAWVTIY